MDQVACEICTKDYERTAVVPRVLKCGHTICTICIRRILRSTSRCPKCRVDINPLALASTFPVNFSLLAMLDSLKNTEPMNEHVKIRALEELWEEWFEIKKIVQVNMTKFSSEIKELEENMDSESADVKIQSLWERLNGQDPVVRTNPFKDLKASMIIKLKDDETMKQFLDEIHSRVLMGELIYAVTIVEETIKYAKLSAELNKLTIHAFDRPVKDPNVKTVWFQELKNSMRECVFEAFLEVGIEEEDKRVIMISPRKCRLIPQIFSLFTGEKGPMYKGLTFQTEVVPDFTNWVLNVGELYNQENMSYDYPNLTDVKWMTAKDYLVVIANTSGNLIICRAPNYKVDFPDVIGVVIEAPNVPKMNLGNLKVFDSGLSTYIDVTWHRRRNLNT